MCSRYFLDADGNVIAYTFRVPVHEHVRKRFNIAPTQEAPVIRAANDGGAREVAMMRWGLVPFWAKDLKFVDGPQTISAGRRRVVADTGRAPQALLPTGAVLPGAPRFAHLIHRLVNQQRGAGQPRRLRGQLHELVEHVLQ